MNIKAMDISRLLAALACAAMLIIVPAGIAGAELTVSASQDRIDVGFFYHGSKVGVRGTSDPDTEIVVKIASPESHLALKKKGKVGGILWMNTGSIAFEDTPNVYFLHSTREVDDILGADERDAHAIGYAAVEHGATVEPSASDEEKDHWFSEFVKYKEASKLYATAMGSVETTPGDGAVEYEAVVDWPYQAPPGDYEVTVYAVRDGRVVDTAESQVRVEQVGSVKYLAEMARKHGAIYGLISIIIAIGAGFGVGIIFKGGGSH